MGKALSHLHMVEIDVFFEGDTKEMRVEVLAPTEEAAQRGKETVLGMFKDAREIVIKGVERCVS